MFTYKKQVPFNQSPIHPPTLNTYPFPFSTLHRKLLSKSLVCILPIHFKNILKTHIHTYMYLLLIYSTELCEANFNSNIIHVGRSHLLHFTDMHPITQYFALYSSWAFKLFPIYGYYKSSHSKL